MGIESSINIGYGFWIPECEYDHLLEKDVEGYHIGDDIYTHEIPNGGFIYGKVLYSTEAGVYYWDGNKDIIDLKKLVKIHHMQKRKIDCMAKKCRAKAIYFAAGNIH
jgi:hypothetical protein